MRKLGKHFYSIATLRAVAILAVIISTGVAHAQTQPLFQNFTFANNPPPINATRVENLGTISLSGSTIPFDTQNTLDFINTPTGIMQDSGGAGFRFDFLETSLRQMSRSFENSGRIFTSGRIDVWSTNITVTGQGLLSADRTGLVSLRGNNVNLFNGRIRAGESSERSNSFEGGTSRNSPTYVHPGNVRENGWGVTPAMNPLLNLSSIANTPSSPFHNITLHPGAPLSLFTFTRSVSPGSLFNFYMNTRFDPPQMGRATVRAVVQCVFINTNIIDHADISVSFGNTTNSGEFFLRDVAVEFSATEQDPLTGVNFSRSMTLLDSSATVSQGTPRAPRLYENAIREGRFRSEAHTMLRSDFSSGPVEPAQPYNTAFLFPGQGGNGGFTSNSVPYVFSSTSYTVNPTDFSQTGFGGSVGAGFVGPFGFGLAGNDALLRQLHDVTNSPGRVEIEANTLNLNLARIRAENFISIKATNITSTEGMQLDAPNVNFELMSSGSTTISNVFPSSVNRVFGGFSAWSGVWRVDQNITNQAPATYNSSRNTPINWLGFSNRVEYVYHVLIIDAPLRTNLPVTVRKFESQPSNVILSDPITISDSFLINGASFTFAPAAKTNVLAFTGDLANINRINATTNLVNFTNLGTISIPSQLNLGFDRTPLSNIVNCGTIQSGSLLFRSKYFESTNFLTAFNGSVFVDAETNVLNGGAITATSAIQFSGGDMKATNVAINAQRLFFNLTNRLTDDAITNTWGVTGGFDMLATPSKGDLLSTSIRSLAGSSQANVHSWAGQDRGDNAAGYANNAALGRLVLDGDVNSQFHFNGVGGGSAIYVDTIQLINNATNFESVVVQPNFRIYFANLVDTNNMPLPADKFTNAHNGRIVWVSPTTRSGPMVNVPLTLSTSTNLTSAAFRSLLPPAGDYDGDGILNGQDAMPLSGFTLNSVSLVNISDPPGSAPVANAKITWQALPSVTYFVEYREEIGVGDWKPLSVRVSVNGGTMTEYDPVPAHGRRYYRVKYTR